MSNAFANSVLKRMRAGVGVLPWSSSRFRVVSLLPRFQAAIGLSTDEKPKRTIWDMRGEEEEEGGEIPTVPVRFRSVPSDGYRQNRPGLPTVRQRRIATEVRETISQALQQGPCQTPILQRCGFEIQHVKMSSDLRVAYVYWTALPGMQQSAEKAAISKVRRLRSLVFERLNLRFSPTIRFEEVRPDQQMLALEKALNSLRRDREHSDNLKQQQQKQKDDSEEEPGKEEDRSNTQS